MKDTTCFDKLSDGVQRWVYKQGWESLRPVQEQSIPLVLSGSHDLLITAPTAGGKTEAAFLPLISFLENEEFENSYGVICLSPLKALINDQFQRLELLCESAGTKITPWHGDINASTKTRSWKAPTGILLITPESLEAMFIRRSHELKAKFKRVNYVVIDEYHAFIGHERGQQLISLLTRLEEMLARPLCRIALSATIGSPKLALKYLRPDNSRPGKHIDASLTPFQLKLSLNTYSISKDASTPISYDMSKDLYSWLRGGRHLVFANSRRIVEEITDFLANKSEFDNIPLEFFAHHGSLSKEMRLFVEKRLKDALKPTTAIATSTLELGLDIGDVISVSNIGAPANVSSIRQRLGRSGRRQGQSAILRMLVTGYSQKKKTCPIDMLEAELFQTIAVMELMFERWIEPPDDHVLHLSTLVQQILSMIAYTGGITASKAYHTLVEKGPWNHLSIDIFTRVLRSLGAKHVIYQLSNGELVIGEIGEQLLSSHTFYTSFEIPEEYTLVAYGKTLGTLPVIEPYIVGQLLLFSGRRWAVIDIDTHSNVMSLVKSNSGQAPVHRVIRQRMLKLYLNSVIPKYCDPHTIQLINSSRAYFRGKSLNSNPYVVEDNYVFWFVWENDRVIDTIKICCSLIGLMADRIGPCVVIECVADLPELPNVCLTFLKETTEKKICASIPAQPLGKFDKFLDANLIKEAFLHEKLDIPSTINYLELLLSKQI